MASNIGFMIWQAWNPPSDPDISFEGKTVIVTGANTGLGFESAAKFVALNASRVIIGVRDTKKGENAKSVIEDRTGKKGKVEVWQLDLNSYDSIQDFAKRSSSLDSLDVAVLNAGVFMTEYDESRYGWEEDLQVNVLSTALLGLQLLPKLKASKKSGHRPVLEIVGSGGHEVATITEEERRADNLLRSYNTAKGYVPSRQYHISKLFVMYVMQTLADFAKPSGATSTEPKVLVLAVCPGVCKSDLARGLSGFVMGLIKVIAAALVLRTTEQGARTFVSGVTLGGEAHRRFWQNDQLKPPVALVSGKVGEELRQKVWSEIIAGLQEDVPSIGGLLAELERS